MPVPFFSDFTKQTKDYFKHDQYNLGNVFEFKNAVKDATFKGKITRKGDQTGAKLTAIAKTSWGNVEVSEEVGKGLSVELTAPQVYRDLTVKSKHSDKEVEVTLEYQPKESFWNAKVKGFYNPSINNNRVCTTTASAAVGDDSLNLAVGGEIVFRDEAPSDSPATSNLKTDTYSVGFLYTPTQTSSYSLIYSKDDTSDGLEYSLTAFRDYQSFQVAANAVGKVDTKVTANPPVIAFGGGFNWNGRFLQLFFNSRKEYGVAYKFSPADFISVNLGLSSLGAQRRTTLFGYKVNIN
jgi:hypothetical protein